MKCLSAAMIVIVTLLPQAFATIMHMGCRAPVPDDRYKAESLAIHKAAMKRVLHPRNFNKRKIDIAVHFTIVTSGSKKEQGHLGMDSINAQIRVLNEGFQRAGFKFWLKSVKHVNNAGWASSNGDPGLQDRQRKFRRGDYKALNIVVIPGLKNGGRCTYPGSFNDNTLLHDRCEVGTAALPNSGTRALGRVTIHEVGHWLGLMHTFENGCNGDGDQVSDTPAHVHSGPIARCPPPGQEPNTCPGKPGKDPVHNFMSYFAEECWSMKEGFTDGQIKRMYQQWDHFRANAPPKKLN